jgi:hypothetical protein
LIRQSWSMTAANFVNQTASYFFQKNAFTPEVSPTANQGRLRRRVRCRRSRWSFGPEHVFSLTRRYPGIFRFQFPSLFYRTDLTPLSPEFSREVAPERCLFMPFVAACPFCPGQFTVPEKALSASVRCPQCGNYFTALPQGPSAQPPPHRKPTPRARKSRPAASPGPATLSPLTPLPPGRRLPAAGPAAPLLLPPCPAPPSPPRLPPLVGSTPGPASPWSAPQWPCC